MKKLPFAAVHGDADVHDGGVTRFGPTAKLVPALERGRLSTVSDFADVFGFSPASVLSYVNILSDRILFPYVVRNLVYDIPEIGKRVPPGRPEGRAERRRRRLERAKGYGGVRPQIVNTETKELDMGEAKITGDGVLFNITPSPGASTALKNAMTDVHTVLDFFDEDHEFDEAAFREATIENFPRVDADAEAGAETEDDGADDHATAEADD